MFIDILKYTLYSIAFKHTYIDLIGVVASYWSDTYLLKGSMKLS